MKIGIQGNLGSFHEQALQQMVGDTASMVCLKTFDEVFEALEHGHIDQGIVAIKNNRYGFIPRPLNQILAGKFAVVGETYVRVDHQLLGVPGSKLGDIKEVYSQAAALGQCTDFLQGLAKANGTVQIEEDDTALSAELVAGWRDFTKAAIASERAGNLHGLVVLQSHVQDDPNNITRFIRIEKRNGQVTPKDANKTTALLRTAGKPGALVRAIQPFADAGINISELHSYTIPNSAFDIEFFIEFDASILDAKVQQTYSTIQQEGGEIITLGSYKKEPVPIS